MGFQEGTPTATVELAGKSRQLGVTVGAMRRMRDLDVLNVDMTDQLQVILVLPEYLWCCMDEEGRSELSVEQIAEVINPLNVTPIAQAVTELAIASLPKKEEPEGNGRPPAAKKPTGGKKKRTSTSSGQSGFTISA